MRARPPPLTPPRAACNATVSRNLTAVFEPVVSASIVSRKQGCAAAEGTVKYTVTVAYTGAKKDAIAAPTTCEKVSAAGLDATGSGTLVYECGFVSAAAAANATLNFTAVGDIPGEVVTATMGLPAAVVAAQPAVEITSSPVQNTLLRHADITTAVNFTVRCLGRGADRACSAGACSAAHTRRAASHTPPPPSHFLAAARCPPSSRAPRRATPSTA